MLFRRQPFLLSCFLWLIVPLPGGECTVKRQGQVAHLNQSQSHSKDPCSNVMRCWQGEVEYEFQVLENSGEVVGRELGYPAPPECSPGVLTYDLSMAPPQEEVLFLGVGAGESDKALVIKGGLDREWREEYSFRVSCTVQVGGAVERLELGGKLTVLDEDDNPPTTQDGATNVNLTISLKNKHNKYEAHQRLIHEDSQNKSLLFRDWDAVGTNSFDLDVQGDWKGLLNVTFIQTQVKLPPKPPYTVLRPTISLSSNISHVDPWPGMYCVKASFIDTSFVPLQPNPPSMMYRICVHWSSNSSLLQESESGGLDGSSLEDTEKVPLSAIMADVASCNDVCVLLLSSVAMSLGILLLVVILVLRNRASESNKGRGLGLLRRGAEGHGDLSGMSMIMMGSEADYLRPDTQPLPSDFSIDSKWEIPRSALILLSPIGTGQFGQVYKGRTDAVPGREGTFVDVAVKMLKETNGDPSKSSRDEFLSEFTLLQQLDHPNVIKVLGVCTTIGGPLYLVMDYAELGSLRGFLRKCRRVESMDSGRPLDSDLSGSTLPSTPTLPEDFAVSPREILQFSWQIAKGMTYLSDMKMVHRDLAARNILLTRGRVCKISDFGLTRDIYVDEAYQKKSRGPVPVKWLAPESLADEVYTKKSDVWSYGVLLWELATLGASPYPGIPAEQLYTLLKGGYRMPAPPNTTTQFYALMRECWALEPTHRPTFRSLHTTLGKMLEDGVEYLKLDLPVVSNPTYNYHTYQNESGPPVDGGAYETPIGATLCI